MMYKWKRILNTKVPYMNVTPRWITENSGDTVRSIPDWQSKGSGFDSRHNRWGPNWIFREFDDLRVTYETLNWGPAYMCFTTIMLKTQMAWNVHVYPPFTLLSLTDICSLSPLPTEIKFMKNCSPWNRKIPYGIHSHSKWSDCFIVESRLLSCGI